MNSIISTIRINLTGSLIVDSPALSAVGNGVCEDRDRRGVSRVQGDPCGIHAFGLMLASTLLAVDVAKGYLTIMLGFVLATP
jgi:hypothetical protein